MSFDVYQNTFSQQMNVSMNQERGDLSEWQSSGPMKEEPVHW